MNIFPNFSKSIRFKKLIAFAVLILCANSFAAAQQSERESNLRSLVAAEREFSRVSEEKGTREAFVAFLADDAVIFNPLPSNGKQIWLAREKSPGVLTWQPVFADISSAGDLGFTTGPYEFRRLAGEKPIGFGYYMSIWQREPASAAWKVVLDIGTRNQPLEIVPTLEFPKLNTKFKKKKIDLERERSAFKSIDADLSNSLSLENKPRDLNDFIGDYLRLHSMDNLPLTKKADSFAALQKYQGKIISQTSATGIAQSGDFAYSYGTYAPKERVDETAKEKFMEKGSFARIWRRDEKGKWKLTLVVMHAAPPNKARE